VALPFALLTSTAAHAQHAATFTTIDVPGAIETDVNDLNTAGTAMVGYYCDTTLCDSGGTANAFVDLNGAIKLLKVPGATQSRAYGINDTNQVVGWYIDAGGITHGFMFSKGKYTKIDPPGSTLTNAWSINNAGEIVGTYVGSDGIYHGFTLTGTTYTKYDAPNGALLTEFTGLDSTGANMVGLYFDSSSVQHGFQLANGTTFTTIDPPGSNTTAADRINDSGMVVGLFCAGSCVQNTGPYSGYEKSGTKYSKVNYPGSTETRLRGINNAGMIVGRYTDTAGTIHGMLGTP
jgi:probable HAF family extracellular repeat protein